MSRARISNIKIAVDHIHLIVGSQNHNQDKYLINSAALLIQKEHMIMHTLVATDVSCSCTTLT